MVFTLAQAELNTQTDYDASIISEFRAESPLLDLLVFDQAVNPAGGGATLTYGYRRETTMPAAAFRAINADYTDSEAATDDVTTRLAVLGGSYSIDRVVADLGPAASGAVAFQVASKIKAAKAKFNQAVIAGDTGVEAAGFDGLDKALTGSSTELNLDGVYDWSAFASADEAMALIDHLDELIYSLDGSPTAIIGNKAALARVRAAARRANMYTQAPVEGLRRENGQAVQREMVGDAVLIDAGDLPGTGAPVIPIDADEGTTSLYAFRGGLDGFHGVTTTNGKIVKAFLPKFDGADAVQRGSVELGPIGVALKASKAAGVLRNVKIR